MCSMNFHKWNKTIEHHLPFVFTLSALPKRTCSLLPEWNSTLDDSSLFHAVSYLRTSSYLPDRGDTMVTKVALPGRGLAIEFRMCSPLWFPQMWETQLHSLWQWGLHLSWKKKNLTWVFNFLKLMRNNWAYFL